MSLRVKYSKQALADLRNEPAKRFLSEVGLPAEDLLFGFAEPTTRRVEANGGARTIIRVGEGGDGADFCADVVSGEVVFLNLADNSVWHVSASPEQFLACLEEFARRYPFGSIEGELEEREVLAEALKEALLAIDSTVFDDDPGYWFTILNDVAIGDYAEE
ncbi:SUKH-4 family immunity protein [Promicromonospora sp. MEB111]|uniref:SUKH-4 family immunity protein n=1 Tax=Promicromonospora sp. MEB111 TaxID=3040301 RepID=UPI0025516832|nr:SUKH-4 family immunity protein [Promicromonospora sp. MEB111]